MKFYRCPYLYDSPKIRQVRISKLQFLIILETENEENAVARLIEKMTRNITVIVFDKEKNKYSAYL